MGNSRLETLTHVFDCHDAALYASRAAGVRQLPLVHVDAHHDIEPARESGAIDIGNFIRAAIQEGIVSEVFWAVPDPMWADRRTRGWIKKELVFAGASAFEPAGDAIATTIAGVGLRVGTLDDVREFAAPVLLDVDVDFMVSAVRHPRAPQWPLAIPWCWPSDLYRRLRAARVDPAVLTVASSTTGGFTPLRWQHLGRELAWRMTGDGPAAALRCFELLREAAEDRRATRLDEARRHCQEAVAVCPAEAAAHLHLAEIEHALGHRETARASFDRARSLDPIYRHPFRTPGPWFLRRTRLREARDAFLVALELDPDDPHAHAGLATVALRAGDASGAAEHAERSLAIAESTGAWRALARARASLREYDAAVAAYHRAMRLTLRGEISFEGPWAANPEHRLADPWHWRDHAELAAVHAARGDVDAALVHYQIAAAAAPWSRPVRWSLARLYARRREWRRAARTVAQSRARP